MSSADLLIRADAGAGIGAGHVMRCLALADAWTETGGRCLFVTDASGPLSEVLRSRGFAVEPSRAAATGDAEEAAVVLDIAAGAEASWIVVDGYSFGSAFFEVLSESGRRVLALDDDGLVDPRMVDILVNQNLHAESIPYPSGRSATRRLLGPSYALVRGEMRRKGSEPSLPPRAEKLLVTLGGDRRALGNPVVQALIRESNRYELTVGVGLSGPEAADHDGPVALLSDPGELATHMRSAELALSAAGSTVWELAFFGIPMLLVVAAANQQRVATSMHEVGAAVSLGDISDLEPGLVSREIRSLSLDRVRRSRLSQRCRSLVDGNGPTRIVAEMRDLAGGLGG